jgi:hypothetical protein
VPFFFTTFLKFHSEGSQDRYSREGRRLSKATHAQELCVCIAPFTNPCARFGLTSTVRNIWQQDFGIRPPHSTDQRFCALKASTKNNSVIPASSNNVLMGQLSFNHRLEWIDLQYNSSIAWSKIFLRRPQQFPPSNYRRLLHILVPYNLNNWQAISNDVIILVANYNFL